jgi:NADPH2:quinone reductase
VLATGVGSTDVTMRRGYYPFAPPIPFVPGYETIGLVDALGAGVKGFNVGEKVCALLVYGGYATHVVRGASEWVKVPEGLDDVECVALILNYVTAYQVRDRSDGLRSRRAPCGSLRRAFSERLTHCLALHCPPCPSSQMIHRVAKLQPGQSALVNCANGGVGQALLDLLRVHGVHAIGDASASRQALVRAAGATPIEGRNAPLGVGVRAIMPDGVDAAFDAIGGRVTAECVRATRKGGTVVWYGFIGAPGLGGIFASAWSTFVGTRLAGAHSAFYGITKYYRSDPKPFREDLAILFELLKDRKISPQVGARLPLLAARKANERLEGGGAQGKIVLVA